MLENRFTPFLYFLFYFFAQQYDVLTILLV